MMRWLPVLLLCAGCDAYGLKEGGSPPGRFVLQGDTAWDVATGLEWTRNPTSAEDHAAARAACTARGWNLPTAKQAATLVDWRTEGTGRDLDVFPPHPTSTCWTSSTMGGTPVVVDFSTRALVAGTGGTHCVYCCRDKQQ